ncbi:PP0621 family protein [Paraburkholderia tagetis]|uniref:Deaminase n=1 Tax=Paraburkholderia tagetis TaxID=2913261 RepID=A0A9X1RLP0_9BURK|nr:PP0621 family protein [Paraburkholderia tagetis]MCG5072770.1 deaminase [Paraburkholderia tagetis]
MRQILLLILLFVVGQWFFKSLRSSQHSRPGADPKQGGAGAWRTGSGAGGPFGTNGADTSGGRAAGNSAGNSAGNATGNAGRSGALPEPMVRCVECGVHAPRSESVSVGTQTFCCAEHARAYDAHRTGQDRPAR